MKVVIASGKGGTGKTTIAASLAVLAAESGTHTIYADCDVEEPNGRLLLRPRILRSWTVDAPVPVVDAERCSVCGACATACQFNALACLPSGVATFPELCHGCGACTLACRAEAITESRRSVGTIDQGEVDGMSFVQGTLAVGEAAATPVIRAVKKRLPSNGLTVIDAPPGTACPAVETMRGADLLILVTEPTPFGLHDLKLAVETARELELTAHVVINRSDIGDGRVSDYCGDENIDVIAEIPNSREVADAYAAGRLPIAAVPAFKESIRDLSHAVLDVMREPMRR